MANPLYEKDVVAWATEQARLLRAGLLNQLDIEHIAEEIEDVGKSEQRELKSRMAVLLTQLLNWQYHPQNRGNGWRRMIKIQRRNVKRALTDTPSLRPELQNPQWWEQVWDDAVGHVLQEYKLDDLPEACPWSADEVLSDEYWPA
jgi:hypothetical protein